MRKEARELRLSKLRSIYFEGLNFLLNDKTDRAIDVFLKMEKLDQKAFDNQLTLGALFRKRGELDRALLLHTRLSELGSLSAKQSAAVRYELAEDYLQAGMFRQAQSLLEALLEEGEASKAIYHTLWQLYERTAQWQKCIDVGKIWQEKSFGNCALQLGHYYCELAEIALKNKEVDLALSYLQEALLVDNRSGRAYLMRAQIAMQRDETVEAIHFFHAIADQAENFIADILPMMLDAYRKIDCEEEFLNWALQKENDLRHVRLTLAVSAYLREVNPNAAFHLLRERFQESGNPLLLSAYLQGHQEGEMLALSALLNHQLSPNKVFQCNECGFRQQHMVWHCPACHAWSSFRPLIEIKKEER